MKPPLRKTRRRIAYSCLGILAAIAIWVFIPGDIGGEESGIINNLILAAAGVLSVFISSETYSDHSARTNDKESSNEYKGGGE